MTRTGGSSEKLVNVAGTTPLSPFALLTHVGRRSGRAFQTPLGAFPFGDGFVLAPAYGRDVDWCRNVLAAGMCALKWMGREYALERPELLPISQAMNAYPLLVRPFIVVPGTKQALWLHRRPQDAQDAVASAAAGRSNTARRAGATRVDTTPNTHMSR